jgi:hypothetical protein
MSDEIILMVHTFDDEFKNISVKSISSMQYAYTSSCLCHVNIATMKYI